VTGISLNVVMRRVVNMRPQQFRFIFRSHGSLTILCLLLVLALPRAVAQPGSLAGFNYRRAITIDHTKVPNTDQVNFPVLFSGTYSFLASPANGGKVANTNGFDIVLTDSTGTQLLNWEIESYSPTDGTVNFWIKVPSISHTSDTVIFLYYGNASITTFQGGSTGSVWDSNYRAVYHLNLDPTAFGAKDSTANANDLTASGSWNGSQSVGGQIGQALSFNGTDDFLDGGTTKLAINNPFIELWMKTSSPWATQGLVSRGQLWTSGWIFQYDGAGSYVWGHYLVDGPAGHGYDYGGYINDSNWHQVATNYATGGSTYVDGAPANTNGRDTDTMYAQHFVIGATDSGSARFFNGSLDEVRISSSPRSADWIRTEYNNQSSPTTFYSVGTEASLISTLSISWPASLAAGGWGLTYSPVTASATGGNGVYTWSATGLPSGLTITGGGVISGTPGAFGVFSVTVRVVDTANHSAIKTYSLVITKVAVTITPPALALYGGQTQQFSATVTNTSNTAVTWSLSPSTGAGTITSTGLYTAPTNITSQQVVTITATSSADSTASGAATITLNPIAISLVPGAAALAAAQTLQFNATVANAANTGVTWSLSPATGAGTLNSTGLYTAPASVSGPITAVITATSVADSTKTAQATLTLTSLAAGPSYPTKY
jgi:hypothetical protein